MHIQQMDPIIEQCKNGDKAAQFAVYKQYYKAMYNTSFRIVNNSFEAEDIMQEAFLAAFTKLDSFSGTVTFGAWLKRIVINKSLTALKQTKKFETISLENVIIKDECNDEIVPEGLEPKDILKAMAQLKINYKLALTLNLIEGYDCEEIAQILNISYENSRTMLSRAKTKLRKQLVHNYGRQATQTV